MPMNPLATASHETRIDIDLTKRTIMEVLQEHTEKDSSLCLIGIGTIINVLMLVAILVCSSTVLKDVAEIKIKLGVA